MNTNRMVSATDAQEAAQASRLSDAMYRKGLSDAEWEQAAWKIREQVNLYSDLDIAALAEDGAREYHRAQEELSSRVGGSYAENSLARTTTFAMMESTERRLSISARAKRLFQTCLLFLVPIAGMTFIFTGIREFIAWSTISPLVLYGGYVILLLMIAGIATAYLVASSVLGRWQMALASLSAGLIAVAITSPIVVKSFRTNERASLTQASDALERAVAGYLVYRDAGMERDDVLSSTQGLAMQKGKVTAFSGTYLFDAPGLPGTFRAEIGNDSGSIYWTIGRTDELQARVALGTLRRDAAGALTLVTATQKFEPIVAQPGVVPFLGRVVATFDPEGQRLLAVQPVLMNAIGDGKPDASPVAPTPPRK